MFEVAIKNKDVETAKKVFFNEKNEAGITIKS